MKMHFGFSCSTFVSYSNLFDDLKYLSVTKNKKTKEQVGKVFHTRLHIAEQQFVVLSFCTSPGYQLRLAALFMGLTHLTQKI